MSDTQPVIIAPYIIQPQPLILYSKSSVATDWQCPRRRYWNYEYDGRGIVGSSTSLELFLGIALHDGLAAIANGLDIDEIAQAAHEQVLTGILPMVEAEVDGINYANEQATLVEGLLRGFHKHAWPILMKDCKIVAIEQEMVYKHDGLTFMAKPDLIIENIDGDWVYVEYKSTSSKKDTWINSWATAIQLHSTVKAVEATLGKAPTQVIVQGLYKGYESYGKQNSPFCYAYKRNGNPPFTQDQIEYQYKAGYKRSPTWEMEGGVKKWVEEMPENILSDQFPCTPPIFVDEDLVNSFFNQRKYREWEIASFTENPDQELDLLFPQKFDACQPSFGKGCSYKKLCFGNFSDPLEAGYVYRETTHRDAYTELTEVGQDA